MTLRRRKLQQSRRSSATGATSGYAPTLLRIGYLDAQSEKTGNHNYYDHYADDVEDVHLFCSGTICSISVPCGSITLI